MTDDLKTAFRNAWLLWAGAVVFIVAFFLFVLFIAYDAPKPDWEMGGKPFVPAQSDYGEGYYAPVTKPSTGGEQ